jgi:nitrogen fixation/metabolism regulation signal transduction histidine kinase
VPAQEQDEVAELTQAFNDMVRDLSESRERIEYLKRIGAWQEFARRLAHEIKNPLTPIQLAAQEVLARYRGDDDDYRRQLQEAVAIVTEEVATLRRLVSEFSSFAKLPEAILEPADLQDFVAEVSRSIPGILESAGPDSSFANVEVRCACEQGGVPARIDSMMLKRALDNLVRNAVRAVLETHPDGGGEVVVDVRREQQWALLDVSDNGPGIPEDAAAQVFDPYYTTKSDGTGLGLAIVKKVVLEHAGEVRCGRSESGGARFRIRIPLGDEA